MWLRMKSYCMVTAKAFLSRDFGIPKRPVEKYKFVPYEVFGQNQQFLRSQDFHQCPLFAHHLS